MSNSSNDRDLKVGIVDDSPLIRALISEAVKNTAGMCVVGEAEDPILARDMIKETNPDVITLDVEMPRMNGIEFLEKLMRLRPMPVIMVSTLTQKGADITLQALELGAMDYIAKPTNQNDTSKLLNTFNTELVQKLKQVKTANQSTSSRMAQPDKASSSSSTTVSRANNDYDLIAIASSTGGIERLRYLFSHLEVNLPPIVVVQHINERYISSLVERTQKIIPNHMDVKAAGDHEFLKENTIYFADNEHHLALKKISGKYQAHALDRPARNGFIASADYLFQSIAHVRDPKPLGLVLSGMGNDGAEGMLALKQAGGTCVGENQESCLVYGMSQAAAKMGALTQEESIQSILKILNAQKKVR